MREFNFSRMLTGILFMFLLTNSSISAQKYELVNAESSLVIQGTSSLHDWEMVAQDQSGVLIFNKAELGELEQLSIEIVTESLKSGKSAMDKNAFKALKSNSNKKIRFQLTKIKEVKSDGNGGFNVAVLGDLTIAGVKKEIPLDLKVVLDANKAILKGSKNIKMTDFKIDPPKAMFGTITTGDEITIEFNTVLSK